MLASPSAAAGAEAAEGDSLAESAAVLDPLSDPAAWPPFPPDHFGMLGRKHLRPGFGKRSASWKYEIKQLDLDLLGGADVFYEAHISPSLNLWLAWRCLGVAFLVLRMSAALWCTDVRCLFCTAAPPSLF